MRDRLDELLQRAKRGLPPDLADVTDRKRESLSSLLARLAFVVAEARSYLEIATDPTIDLAASLERARDDGASAKQRLKEYEATCVSLMATLDAERARADALEGRVTELRQEVNRADRRVEEAFRKDPESLLAAYSGGPVVKRRSARRDSR